MKSMKIYKNYSFRFIIIALQFTLLFLLYIPFFKHPITVFSDRAIGQALIKGIDESKVVNSMYRLLFVLIPITTIIISSFLQKFLKDVNIRIIRYMELISLLGCINTVLAFINKLQDSGILILSVKILLIINIVLICCCIKKNNFQNTKWVILSAIPIAFFISLILHKLNITIRNYEQNNWIFSYIIGIIFLYLLSNYSKININVLKKAYTIFLCAPLLESLYLELYNILNQYNIILKYKIRTIIIIYTICMIITILYYILNRKKKIAFKYTKYYYPIIIATFSFIIAGISMINLMSTEFFESANHGMAVYELFRYGKLPIIETFDAHMMSNQIWGILYGILNHDIKGATFILYYSYRFVIYYFVIYLFMKKIFSRDTAFLITLFFNFENDILTYFYMGIIAILTLLNAYKKKNFKSYLLYWGSLAFLCLWQLDIGFSISMATVLVLIYLLFKDRKEINLKNILIPFVLVVVFCFVAFFTMCIIKNVNPLIRLLEFLKLTISNINWSYSTFGDPKLFAYALCYYIMPIIIGFILIKIINNKDTNLKIILMSLGLFYVFNFQRGIIRHSLVENTLVLTLNFSILYIALFIAYYTKKDVKSFLIFYIIFIIISDLLLSQNVRLYNNAFEIALNKYTTFNLHEEVYTEKVDRVKISDKMKIVYSNLQDVVEKIMEENETYLDFTNATLLYALFDKEKPVYINQSPGLLSGELTQSLYINEIENSSKDVSFAIKVNNYVLDEIKNEYRYYLVSEFLYDNYIPFIQVDSFEIWVKKEKYEEKLNLLQNSELSNYKVIDNDLYFYNNQDVFALYELPYIWGQYDSNKGKQKIQKELANNLKINQSDININIENITDINKVNGNYIKLKLESPIESTISLKLYDENTKVGEYGFIVKPGINEYMIRVSTIYGWYMNCIDCIKLNASNEVNLIDMSILEADTLKQIK